MEKALVVLKFCIRLAIGAGIIGALFYYELIDVRVLLHAASSPGHMAIAFLLLFATAPLAAIRWWYLLRAIGFRPTVRWAISITFISLYFSLFLPGAHGGDLVRIGIAYRAAGGKLNRITLSVIVDRLAGVVSLLALAVALLFWLPLEYREWVEIMATVSVVAIFGSVGVAIRCGNQIGDLLRLLPKPFGPTLSHMCFEIVAALRQYVDNLSVLAVAFGISLLQYIFVIIALIVIGKAMDFNALSLTGYGISSVWAIVANSLPISPGGLGVGEAAFAQIASSLELTRSGASYASAFLAMRVLSLLIGIGGLIPLAIYRNDVRHGMGGAGRDGLDQGTEPQTGAKGQSA